jgi:2-polyprenyl-3-methyl-5-hydroxy-6-metoxy-1,4-benzoquinol methylase
VESDSLRLPDASFDCVICADVLEHLHQPAVLLQRVGRWLTDSGVLIASIPNVGYHPVVRSLLEGNWTYQASGHLDQGHVQFFTRGDLHRLFESAGYRIARLSRIPGEGYADWERQGYPCDISLGRLSISGMAPEDAADLFTYQFLIEARPDNVVDRPQP